MGTTLILLPFPKSITVGVLPNLISHTLRFMISVVV